MTGFLYLSGGEALVEINGQSYLCAPGHLLLIPENTPFAFLYFEDSVGYSCGFKSILHEPIQQAFWFDEATFVSELFRQMHAAFQRGHAVIGDKLNFNLNFGDTPTSFIGDRL